MNIEDAIDEMKRNNARGWVMHPLSRPDDNGNSPGKRPLIPGWQNLKKTPENMKEYITKGYNPGLVCGQASNIVVFDFDSELFLKYLFPNGTNTLESQRTSGRRHAYFSFNSKLSSQADTKYLQIEIHSDGTNIVLPFSIHASGDVYYWIDSNIPIRTLTDKEIQHILAVFSLSRKIRDILRLSGRCFEKLLDVRPNMNSGEDRVALLGLFTELMINHASEEELHFIAKLIFKNEYKESDTNEGLRGIDISKPARCNTLRQAFGKYFDFGDICSGCTRFKRKQRSEDTYEPPYTNFDSIPEVDHIDDIQLPQEDLIPPISFEGLPDYSFHKMFIDHIAKISDTYPEYSFQNATSTLATLTRRRLFLKLNGRKEFTNLINLNLGQSGYARKGSAMFAAQKLLKDGIGNTFLSQDMTPEGLLSEIADTIITTKNTKEGIEDIVEDRQFEIRKALCSLWKDEAGQFYAQLNKPHMQSMKELVCHFYDCPDEYNKTLSAKKFHIGEIFLSMNLATTPTSFIQNVTTKDVHTGFLARHNIVNPAYQKKRKPITEDTEDNLIEETALISLVKILDGLLPDKGLRVRIGKEELEMVDNWCKDREEYFAKEKNEIMGSFFARFQINVLKIATLIDLGNIPAYACFYNGDVDNSQTENRIIIRPKEIISKKGFLHTKTSAYAIDIVLHNNNNLLSDYIISGLGITKMSLLFAMKLYDAIYIPYAYQICVMSRVDLFANYLSGIYKILQEKKKIDRASLMRLSHVSKRADFDEAIESLKEAGAALEYRVKGKTKSIRVYVFIPTPYTKLNFNSTEYNTEVDNGFIELTRKRYVETEAKPSQEEVKSKTGTQEETLLEKKNINPESQNTITFEDDGETFEVILE